MSSAEVIKDLKFQLPSDDSRHNIFPTTLSYDFEKYVWFYYPIETGKAKPNLLSDVSKHCE